MDIKDRKFDDPVKIDSKNIDAAALVIDNLMGRERDLQQEYTGTFSETTSEEDAYTGGFTLSIKNSTQVGGETSFVKNTTEIEVTTSHEWSNRKSKGREASREVKVHRRRSARPQDAFLDHP